MKSKKNRLFIIAFTLPCALSLFILYLYPIVRTVIMSFFGVESVTASMSNWSFNGIANYQKIFSSPTFHQAIKNMLLIWVIGGILVLSFALLFAVILTSGIRFKKFFRAAIYMPNIISAVALATMWIQYIYNQEYGLLNRFLEALGLEGRNWMGTDMKFWTMLFAFVFGAVGYYMLISGIFLRRQPLTEQIRYSSFSVLPCLCCAASLRQTLHFGVLTVFPSSSGPKCLLRSTQKRLRWCL